MKDKILRIIEINSPEVACEEIINLFKNTISKSRIDYFLDKKDKDYNPNLDSFNLSAKGYNEAIKDCKKEVEKIYDFESYT